MIDESEGQIKAKPDLSVARKASGAHWGFFDGVQTDRWELRCGAWTALRTDSTKIKMKVLKYSGHDKTLAFLLYTGAHVE